MATPRTSKAALQRSLQQSSLPVYLVTPELAIVWANPAAAAWVDLDVQAVTDLTCVYQSSVENPPSEQIANGLCPPPDCFEGRPRKFFVYRRIGDQLEFRQAMSSPLGQSENGVLVTVFGDARERPEEPVESDRLDNRQLHAAIAQMQYDAALQINVDLIVGHSPVAQKIRRQIRVAGQTGSSLLITGLPGSGRRKIAQLIHFANGPAMAGPLIPIECNLVDAEGMQSVVKDLYRQQQQHPDEPLGRLLLLDVDCLAPAAREELVGFLTLPDFDLPLLATGGRDCRRQLDPVLWELLSTLVIELPTLADRAEDIPYLVQAILEQGNAANDAQFSGFDSTALEFLQQYAWPGQLDELIDVTDAARLQATPPEIGGDDLPAHIRIAVRAQSDEANHRSPSIDLDHFLAEIESELIERALVEADGNKSRAARLLGISRARLLRRLNDDVAVTPQSGEPGSEKSGPGEPGHTSGNDGPAIAGETP